MLVAQVSIAAWVLPIVAIRFDATTSSDMRWSRLPVETWICSFSICSASFDWRAISRVIRLPVALIIVLPLVAHGPKSFAYTAFSSACIVSRATWIVRAAAE